MGAFAKIDAARTGSEVGNGVNGLLRCVEGREAEYMMGRVTLQTIADRVGVSRMTVSNAFCPAASRILTLSGSCSSRSSGLAAASQSC